MNKGTYTAKKYCIEKFEAQNLKKETLLHQYWQKIQKLQTRRNAKHRCKSVDEDVIKFKMQM